MKARNGACGCPRLASVRWRSVASTSCSSSTGGLSAASVPAPDLWQVRASASAQAVPSPAVRGHHPLWHTAVELISALVLVSRFDWLLACSAGRGAQVLGGRGLLLLLRS